MKNLFCLCFLLAALFLPNTTKAAYDPTVGVWLSRDPLPNAERRQGPNLYDYVYNNPVNLRDPLGLYGAGVVVGAQGSAGVGIGSGGQVSGGAGSFYNQQTGGTTLGGYVSNGGMAGGMDGNNAIAGGSVSGGGGLFFTNAKQPCELKGPFQQWDANFPLFSINFASSNGTWIVTITAGPSTPTISFTSYTTTTTGTAQTPAF